MNNIFIDTNYFLRFFLNDNSKQAQHVTTLFKHAALDESVTLYTSTLVFFEIFWVLSSFYKRSKEEILFLLQGILKLSFIRLEERNVLQATLLLWQDHTIELEDCYNVCIASQLACTTFASYDKKVIKLWEKL